MSINESSNTKVKYLLPCALLISLSLLFNGCSTTSRLGILKKGDNVSIDSPVFTPIGPKFKITDKGVAEDAKTGANVGAAGGALSGLACGPFFWICSPMFATAGALGGTVAGATVGSAHALSQDQKILVNAKMTSYIRQNVPQDLLLTKVRDRASKNYQVVPEQAEKWIILQIDALGLNSYSDGRLALVINVSIKVNYTDKHGKTKTKAKAYEYVSSPDFVENWIEDNDKFYQLKFDDAFRTLADSIARTL